MKKITSFILSLAVFIGSCFFISDNTVNAYADSQKWDFKYSYEANGEFSVDTAQKSGDGKYSIKIKNNDYGVSRVEKSFKVKPNTTYRATVMAKCVDYKKSGKSNHDFSNFGAVLATAQRVPSGVGTTSDKWQKLTYYFDSGDKTKYTLALYNTGCKGTAYFSDFRLEEVTNEWNFCVVYVNSIKAQYTENGKKKTYSKTFSQEDKDYCTSEMKKLYNYLSFLSEGKINVKSIDFYECEETVTSLTLRTTEGNECYYTNCKDKALKNRLDEIIKNAKSTSGKQYDHIVILSPLSFEVANGLQGINIGSQTAYSIPTCVICVDLVKYSKTLIATAAHEICHTFEFISEKIDPANTVPFHAFYKNSGYKYSEMYHYGQYGLLGSGAWQSDYMRKVTYDGKGINEDAYYLLREVVYANGKAVSSTKKTTFKKTDVGTLTISDISDKTYTGKVIKPSVTVKYGKTKLKKGTDYTVSYSCNTDIGIATAIIKGKGKYSGTVGQNFNIVPPKTTLTVTSSGSNCKLSWKASKGATKYEIYGSTDGKKYKLLKTVEATDKDTTLSTKISNGKKYTFKIRACTELYPQTFYSGYSFSK